MEYFGEMLENELEVMGNRLITASGAANRLGTKCSGVLLRIFTHAQFTTRQLNTLLHQLGHSSLPGVMLITLRLQDLSTQIGSAAF